MAKPQLPAKAWLLEGYHEWFETNVNSRYNSMRNVKEVTVLEDHETHWYVSGNLHARVPKRFIEFKPPVCPKCEGSGYQTIRQLNSRVRIAKKCDCQ